MTVPTRTPEEFSRDIPVSGLQLMGPSEVHGLEDLIRARDEAIRADERGRCSVVHATLTDEALVAELVRRGVLREVEAECDDEVEGLYCHSDTHWSLDRHEGKRRYVTAWVVDPRGEETT